MSGLPRIALALGVTALVVGPALAQRPQQGQRQGMQRGGFGSLVQNESVQKELKLDQDAVTKATEAVRKVQENHRDDFAKLRDLSQEERRTKTRELTRTVNEETLKALGDVLKPEQVKRLKQIELQQAGAEAFTRADVQKALNLTEEQNGKIKTIADEAATQMRGLFGGGRGQGGQGGGQGNRGNRGQGGGPDQEKLAALRKQTTEKVMAVLTDDQKKAWKDLTGDPFQVQNRRRAD
jgi:hypothetical protein